MSIALSCIQFPLANAATTQNNTWTSLAPMPTARGGLGVTVAYGKIYAIGGTNGAHTLNVNEEYDPANNHWSTKAPMPTARSGFAISVYNNHIYCIGGTVGNSFIANTEVYDPITDTWETKSSMPTPRADLSANIVNDKIYLIGGKKYSSTAPYYSQTSINEVYNPATDSWSRNASMPTAVQGYASAVIGDRIYFVGGSKPSSQPGFDTVINANQIYDTQTDRWSTGKIMDSTTTYGDAVATSGFMASEKIYYLGGFSSGSFTSKAKIYSPLQNSWSDGVAMPTARGYLSVAAINDVIYAIGGFDGGNWLNANEQFTPQDYGKTPPKIVITSPENSTYGPVNLAYSANRGATWAGYSLDDSANVTLQGQIALTGLSQGSHHVVVYVNDSLGNTGVSNTVYFSVDTLAPKVTILLPNNQSYGSTDVQLTFILDEPAKDLSYSLDGKEKTPIIGNITLPALPDGSHNLTVYATDDIGNSGSSNTIYFTIATFPTFLVATIIATAVIVAASVYLLFKRRK
jgi:N-acetylneuraminic acid mutarotase